MYIYIYVKLYMKQKMAWHKTRVAIARHIFLICIRCNWGTMASELWHTHHWLRMPASRAMWTVATCRDVGTLRSDPTGRDTLSVVSTAAPTFLGSKSIPGNPQNRLNGCRYLVELGADCSNIVRMAGGINAWKRQFGLPRASWNWSG